jgi:hypothetical protein
MAPSHSRAAIVTGDQLRARRHAREIVAELRWHGVTVPPRYVRMADEFRGCRLTG